MMHLVLASLEPLVESPVCCCVGFASDADAADCCFMAREDREDAGAFLSPFSTLPVVQVSADE